MLQISPKTIGRVDAELMRGGAAVVFYNVDHVEGPGEGIFMQEAI